MSNNSEIIRNSKSEETEIQSRTRLNENEVESEKCFGGSYLIKA